MTGEDTDMVPQVQPTQLHPPTIAWPKAVRAKKNPPKRKIVPIRSLLPAVVTLVLFCAIRMRGRSRMGYNEVCVERERKKVESGGLPGFHEGLRI
jgi:hypothetical protein